MKRLLLLLACACGMPMPPPDAGVDSGFGEDAGKRQRWRCSGRLCFSDGGEAGSYGSTQCVHSQADADAAALRSAMDAGLVFCSPMAFFCSYDGGTCP